MFVFFMKRDMPERLQKALLGFASGVMLYGRGLYYDIYDNRTSDR